MTCICCEVDPGERKVRRSIDWNLVRGVARFVIKPALVLGVAASITNAVWSYNRARGTDRG